jgi:diguanylate cyclase (GGDEF)-like protein
MHLDVATLSVVTVFVTALLGALLVFAGLQNRGIGAPMWWGTAQIIGAVGLALATSRGAVSDFLAVDLANALVLLGYGLTWAGARVFDGRKLSPLVVVFAPVIWMFACRIPAFEHDPNLALAVASAMMAMLAAATAEEFWRGRAEPLMSRWPTVIVLLAYAGALLARIPASYFSPLLDAHSLLHGVSFALIAFGTLLFTVVMSFLLLNMTKERTELRHKIDATVDPLSGIANRRAFLDGAGRLLAQQAVDREPIAMLLFDLDRFKEINDRMGHAVGDRVLQTFAASTGTTLGADVLFGRIGGEEFAALLPVGDLGEAYAIADRVRRNFAGVAARFANGDLLPTVSVGLTLGIGGKCPLDTLLAIADRALYRAKANGRDRVEATAPLDEAEAPVACAPSIVPLIGSDRLAPARRPLRRAAR